MTEIEQLKAIFKRLGLDILYEEEGLISFETNNYGDLDVSFDENGEITKFCVDV